MKKILNLFSLFFAIIGLCAVALICHIIFIYPNFNKQSSNNDNLITAQTASAIVDPSPTIQIGQQTSPLPVEAYDNHSPDVHLETNSQMQASDNQDIPAEYQNALNKANDYSNSMYMSKAAIYDQLTSAYGEHFSPEAAQYAIDNIVADWSLNALQKAKDYSDTMYMSKAAIYDQLLSDSGEKFTQTEAQYAVDNLITDYNTNALQKARDYQNTMNMSLEAIRNQLISEYGERFTPEQADYAVANLSSGNNTESSSTLYSIPVEQNISSANYIAEEPVQNIVTQNTSESNLNSPNAPVSQTSTPIGDMVWLSATGEKYHSIDHCGRMNPDKARQVSLEEAISRGYEKCEKCF